MTGNSEKAAHYISLLDTARVNAAWSDIPELVRKVNKHAPQRKVLIQTAAAEHEVATGSSTGVGRPFTSSGPNTSPLSTLLSALQGDVDTTTEDAFQGKTCLLWSRWVKIEANAGTTGFDTATVVRNFERKDITTWTKICVVKSAYIEGTSYMRNGRPIEAQKTFDAALSILQSNKNLVLATPQLAYWAEQLLAQQALGNHQQMRLSNLDTFQTEALKYWSIIASKTREVSATAFNNSPAHTSRLFIWKRYYEYLSTVLWRQGQSLTTIDSATRMQQATEIRRVEKAYESELLRTTKFPTATESNAAIEEWVEQAIRTWKALCGSRWSEAELGEGGRNAIARNMLDVLYRAAAKTFHSTLILRHLFQVHLSLGEFDLAYRAFDTYMELVDRGRIRSAKSNKLEPGHQSHEAVLSTIAGAIFGLCKFGRQAEARKANDLCLKLKDWLVSIGIEQSEKDQYQDRRNGRVNGDSTHLALEPDLLQMLYRAMGTGKANWARWTPESESRSALQEEALANLEKASGHGESDIETLYATSLLLAETRNIPGAIQAVKRALAKNTSTDTSSSGWVTERKSVSLWHLLALLLSSRQDFDSATKGCVAAFEQFATSDFIVGPGRNSSVASSIEKQFNATLSNIADGMECDELSKIIEVRITELALTELIDGPEEAVNSSNELLSLYSRLFAHLQVPLETSTVRRTVGPPKSSAGTVKSARTSIFGRRRHEQVVTTQTKNDDAMSIMTDTTRPETGVTQAPTIQITNEDEKHSEKKQHRKSHDSSHSRHSKMLSHRLSQRHDGKADQVDEKQAVEQSRVVQRPQLETLPSGTVLQTPTIPLEHERSADSKRELPEVGHNLASHDNVPPPASHDEQPPQQDVRLPTLHTFTNATSPPPRFSKSIAQKHALMILAKVWLVIATLYRRASMFEDSKEACEEAGKAAAKIEALVGAIDHSARAFATVGWGAGTKSSDEIWADIYCERAYLQLAIYKQKVKEDTDTNNDELRAALDDFEQCLMFVPDHPAGIVGLSNVLLDSYERKFDLGRRVNDGRLQLIEQERTPSIVVTSDDQAQIRSLNGTVSAPAAPSAEHVEQASHLRIGDDDLKKTPENLNRIAARDRAYGLLSTLTKLGSGWDNSEAWFALARAHELGGETEKAKSVLWWCVELEDTKPIRHWRNLGYSL